MAELDTILTLEKFTAIKSKANFSDLEKKLKIFWPLWETFAANPAIATDDTVQKLKKAILGVTDEAGTLVEIFTNENRAKKPEYAYVVGVQMKSTKLRVDLDKIVKEAQQAESLRKLKEQELARINKEAARPTDLKNAAPNQQAEALRKLKDQELARIDKEGGTSQAAALRKLKDEELARIDKEADGKQKEKAEKINKLRELIAKKAGSLPTPAPDTKVWRLYVKLAQEAGLKVTELAATLDLYCAKGNEYLTLVKDMGIRLPKVREAWMKGDASQQKEINQYKLDQQKARDLGARLSPLAQKNNEICTKLHNKYNDDDVIKKLVGPMGRTAGALAASFAPGAQDWVYAVNFDNPPPAPTPAGPSGAWRPKAANPGSRAEDPYITDEPKEDHYNSERETEKAYN